MKLRSMEFVLWTLVFGLLPAAALAKKVVRPKTDAAACIAGLRGDMSKESLQTMARKMPKFFAGAGNKKGVILIDYSLHNVKDRMFLIDLEKCEVVYQTRVTHGGRWSIFYDINGKKLPNSTGYHRYDTFSPGDPKPTDHLLTCRNPLKGNSLQHMTRPGFVMTNGCHTTGLTGWTTLWKSGGRNCNGIRLRPLEDKQGNMAGVVIHEHERLKHDTVSQGCPATMPGFVAKMMSAGREAGFDIRSETLVYLYAPQCGE